ncbi:MAG TPA: SDR family oxidoreductase [Saprospiraceae bacterium]|nr:SDR family oxidoreductase [Saprospiraceae bacterium]
MSKTILITGASTGIGCALARYLAECGHRVFITQRQQVCRPIKPGDYPKTLYMDVRDESSIMEAVQILQQQFAIKSLDVLINNAGIAVTGPLEQLTLEEQREQFEVNVFGALTVCRHFLPMLKAGKGKILQMGSMSSRMAIPFVGMYGASKAALKQISWSLRLELKPWDVEVCHLELGNFPSEIWNKANISEEHLAQNPYKPYLLNIKRLMESRAQHFNPVNLLCEKVERIIHRKNNPFNITIGRDARMRKWLCALLPDKVLENNLLKRLEA